MAGKKTRNLVVTQLSGGNDYLNCVVPYTNPRYMDARRHVGIAEDAVIPLDRGYGLNPGMQPIKELYELGKVAIIHGVAYNKKEHLQMQVPFSLITLCLTWTLWS